VSAFRPSGEWNDDDFDVLADGLMVGHIMNAAAVPVGQSGMWTLAFGYHDRVPETPPWFSYPPITRGRL
jgi:hypothetical protein